MPAITENVSFDTVAREWRCKWSTDNEKASLVELQKVLDKVLPQLKKLDGFKKVQRVVCGACLDFKVISSLSADSFGAWEKASFEPEQSFIKEIKAIEGVSEVETQTYTLMEV